MILRTCTYVNRHGDAFTRVLVTDETPTQTLVIGDEPYTRLLVTTLYNDAAEWQARALQAEQDLRDLRVRHAAVQEELRIVRGNHVRADELAKVPA